MQNTTNSSQCLNIIPGTTGESTCVFVFIKIYHAHTCTHVDKGVYEVTGAYNAL